jgi:hypothetical protein
VRRATTHNNIQHHPITNNIIHPSIHPSIHHEYSRRSRHPSPHRSDSCPHHAGSGISMWRLRSPQRHQRWRSSAMPPMWISDPLQDSYQAMYVLTFSLSAVSRWMDGPLDWYIFSRFFSPPCNIYIYIQWFSSKRDSKFVLPESDGCSSLLGEFLLRIICVSVWGAIGRMWARKSCLS